eukprot:5147368-Pleurochrysis_carterae.AAC.4
MLSESLVLSGGPQILAVNFFEPKVWSYNNDGDGDVHVPTYPGLYDCCAVTDAVRKRQVCGMLGKTCPAAPRVLVDKKWISAELGRLAEFASHVGRPVWIDQFGMQSTDDAALKAQARERAKAARVRLPPHFSSECSHFLHQKLRATFLNG